MPLCHSRGQSQLTTLAALVAILVAVVTLTVFLMGLRSSVNDIRTNMATKEDVESRLFILNGQLVKIHIQILNYLRRLPHKDDQRLNEIEDTILTPLPAAQMLGRPFSEKAGRVRPSVTVPGAIAIVMPHERATDDLIEVKSMAHGRVVKCQQETEEADGKTVKFWTIEILHDFGYRSFYGHLDRVNVKLNDLVPQGKGIALAKAASPVCLRLGVKKPGSDKIHDPRPYLQSPLI